MRQKAVHGFQTGDVVRADVLQGVQTGTYHGRVAVRQSGSFNVQTAAGVVQGISWKCCTILHRADGYDYALGKAFLPQEIHAAPPHA